MMNLKYLSNVVAAAVPPGSIPPAGTVPVGLYNAVITATGAEPTSMRWGFDCLYIDFAHGVSMTVKYPRKA